MKRLFSLLLFLSCWQNFNSAYTKQGNVEKNYKITSVHAGCIPQITSEKSFIKRFLTKVGLKGSVRNIGDGVIWDDSEKRLYIQVENFAKEPLFQKEYGKELKKALENEDLPKYEKIAKEIRKKDQLFTNKASFIEKALKAITSLEEFGKNIEKILITSSQKKWGYSEIIAAEYLALILREEKDTSVDVYHRYTYWFQ